MDRQSYYFRKNYYSDELKNKICKEHMEDGSRLRDLVRKYNLSSHSLIHEWLRNLGYLPGNNRRITKCNYIGIENVQMRGKSQKKNHPLTRDQQQIEFLKKELEDAKLLAEGYQRMIEIAESELKIPIRKKPNTK
jgi:transposase